MAEELISTMEGKGGNLCEEKGTFRDTYSSITCNVFVVGYSRNNLGFFAFFSLPSLLIVGWNGINSNTHSEYFFRSA